VDEALSESGEFLRCLMDVDGIFQSSGTACLQLAADIMVYVDRDVEVDPSEAGEVVELREMLGRKFARMKDSWENLIQSAMDHDEMAVFCEISELVEITESVTDSAMFESEDLLQSLRDHDLCDWMGNADEDSAPDAENPSAKVDEEADGAHELGNTVSTDAVTGEAASGTSGLERTLGAPGAERDRQQVVLVSGSGFSRYATEVAEGIERVETLLDENRGDGVVLDKGRWDTLAHDVASLREQLSQMECGWDWFREHAMTQDTFDGVSQTVDGYMLLGEDVLERAGRLMLSREGCVLPVAGAPPTAVDQGHASAETGPAREGELPLKGRTQIQTPAETETGSQADDIKPATGTPGVDVQSGWREDLTVDTGQETVANTEGRAAVISEGGRGEEDLTSEELKGLRCPDEGLEGQTGLMRTAWDGGGAAGASEDGRGEEDLTVEELKGLRCLEEALEGQKGLMRTAWDGVMVSVGNVLVFTELETLMVVARDAIDRIIRTSVRFTKKAGRLKNPLSRTQMDRQHANSGSNDWDAKSDISKMARGVLDGGERQRDTKGIRTLQPDLQARVQGGPAKWWDLLIL
jgi:hypothetical protein